ncbi:MAG TPA: zinc ribbon domain-containing protein [Anaerolineales bacterium]|nr:zinc ribbon domain-containing protein [Anaerolineales bacterium]
MNQRMFHGGLSAAALADQLAARFTDRQHRTAIRSSGSTALVQIGSKHGSPVTVHIADTPGGVLVSMSRDRNWLDKIADSGELIERASRQNLLSMLAMVPDVIGELTQENIAPQIWEAINDLCALSQALAGEKDAPRNPKMCGFCGMANPAENNACAACGAALPVELPRVCPKCAQAYTSAALFCQACGTRLITEAETDG